MIGSCANDENFLRQRRNVKFYVIFLYNSKNIGKSRKTLLFFFDVKFLRLLRKLPIINYRLKNHHFCIIKSQKHQTVLMKIFCIFVRWCRNLVRISCSPIENNQLKVLEIINRRIEEVKCYSSDEGQKQTT